MENAGSDHLIRCSESDHLIKSAGSDHLVKCVGSGHLTRWTRGGNTLSALVFLVVLIYYKWLPGRDFHLGGLRLALVWSIGLLLSSI